MNEDETDVDLCAIDPDKSIVVTLRHDEKLDENGHCYIQSALLYVNLLVSKFISHLIIQKVH